MNRSLILTLVVVGLTWVAEQYAAIARIQNTLPYPVKVYTQTRKCGEFGWGFKLETIQPNGWLDLCSASPIRVDLLVPEVTKKYSEYPVFMEKGRSIFSYTANIPKDTDWVLYVVEALRAGGDIQGNGWITHNALEQLSKGTSIDNLDKTYFQKIS